MLQPSNGVYVREKRRVSIPVRWDGEDDTEILPEAEEGYGVVSAEVSSDEAKIVGAADAMERCSVVLELLAKRLDAFWFARPVQPEEAPDYAESIPNPMDFSTIRTKLKDKLYKEVDEFASDVRLVYCNAVTYNWEPNNQCALAARAGLTHFERFLPLILNPEANASKPDAPRVKRARGEPREPREK